MFGRNTALEIYVCVPIWRISETPLYAHARHYIVLQISSHQFETRVSLAVDQVQMKVLNEKKPELVEVRHTPQRVKVSCRDGRSPRGQFPLLRHFPARNEAVSERIDGACNEGV